MDVALREYEVRRSAYIANMNKLAIFENFLSFLAIDGYRKTMQKTIIKVKMFSVKHILRGLH